VPEPPTRRLDWGGSPEPDLFERREDPKGWDRASITVKTHPLHPFPRVTQADFIVPSASDWLRLVGDCLVFGACVGLISFFPLWIADVMASGRLANWVWGTMAVIGALGAVFLFVVASRNERAYFDPL
jgi:hypothetical protein